MKSVHGMISTDLDLIEGLIIKSQVKRLFVFDRV